MLSVMLVFAVSELLLSLCCHSHCYCVRPDGYCVTGMKAVSRPMGNLDLPFAAGRASWTPPRIPSLLSERLKKRRRCMLSKELKRKSGSESRLKKRSRPGSELKKRSRPD